jgi:ribosomal protein S18 acetylase RimI-like enzyme
MKDLPYNIIKLVKEDASEAAEIHMRAFPGFFLTNLGKSVLTLFYESIINDSSCVAFGIKSDNKLLGFQVSALKSEAIYRHIFQQNFFRFVPYLIIRFLKNPFLLFRMIVSYKSATEHKKPDNCNAALLSICVDPSFSGKGFGRELINSLEAELVQKHLNCYSLTTDANNNFFANQFYLKNGFVLYSDFFQGSRHMNLYIKYL